MNHLKEYTTLYLLMHDPDRQFGLDTNLIRHIAERILDLPMSINDFKRMMSAEIQPKTGVFARSLYRRGLTQRQIAELLGIAQPTVAFHTKKSEMCKDDKYVNSYVYSRTISQDDVPVS
jgi:predicted XRE-type DNA-binding protein